MFTGDAKASHPSLAHRRRKRHADRLDLCNRYFYGCGRDRLAGEGRIGKRWSSRALLVSILLSPLDHRNARIETTCKNKSITWFGRDVNQAFSPHGRNAKNK